jgi:hypothetical protein
LLRIDGWLIEAADNLAFLVQDRGAGGHVKNAVFSEIDTQAEHFEILLGA